MMPEMCCASSASGSSSPRMPERAPRSGGRHPIARPGSASRCCCSASSPAPPRRPSIAAASDGYGYRDQQIESNRYRVSFSGNVATDLDAVRDYALYRAAELTLARCDDFGGGRRTPNPLVRGRRPANRGRGRRRRLAAWGRAVEHPRLGGGSPRTTRSSSTSSPSRARPAADLDAYDAREVIRGSSRPSSAGWPDQSDGGGLLDGLERVVADDLGDRRCGNS